MHHLEVTYLHTKMSALGATRRFRVDVSGHGVVLLSSAVGRRQLDAAEHCRQDAAGNWACRDGDELVTMWTGSMVGGVASAQQAEGVLQVR